MQKETPIWAIIQACSGVYCAVFATAVYFFPREPQISMSPKNIPPAGGHVNLSIGLIVGLAALGLSVAIPALHHLWIWIRTDKSAPKLKIHQAFYGTGPSDDVSVIETLRRFKAEGLVTQVDNNTLGCDPAPGRPKRLRVTYSYLNEAVWEISRPEYSRLILPEDKEFIECMAAEYENKRRADLEAQAKQLPSAFRSWQAN